MIAQKMITPSQTPKSLWTFFCTFDETRFLPKKFKKSKGRQADTKLTPKTKYEIAKNEYSHKSIETLLSKV